MVVQRTFYLFTSVIILAFIYVIIYVHWELYSGQRTYTHPIDTPAPDLDQLNSTILDYFPVRNFGGNVSKMGYTNNTDSLPVEGYSQNEANKSSFQSTTVNPSLEQNDNSQINDQVHSPISMPSLLESGDGQSNDQVQSKISMPSSVESGDGQSNDQVQSKISMPSLLESGDGQSNDQVQSKISMPSSVESGDGQSNDKVQSKISIPSLVENEVNKINDGVQSEISIPSLVENEGNQINDRVYSPIPSFPQNDDSQMRYQATSKILIPTLEQNYMSNEPENNQVTTKIPSESFAHLDNTKTAEKDHLHSKNNITSSILKYTSNNQHKDIHDNTMEVSNVVPRLGLGTNDYQKGQAQTLISIRDSIRNQNTNKQRYNQMHDMFKELTLLKKQSTVERLNNDQDNANIQRDAVNTINKSAPKSTSFKNATLVTVEHYDRNVLMYTALLSNMTDNSSSHRLAIQIWENETFTNMTYVCCVRYKSMTIRRFALDYKEHRNFEVLFRAKQIVCNLPKYIYYVTNDVIDVPEAVALVPEANGGEVCPVDKAFYLNIEHVDQYPGKIAVFAKLIYHNVSMYDLIAWLEINIKMGADKVFFYEFNLNENAKRVLQYYQNKGIAEVIPFTFPDYYTKVHKQIKWEPDFYDCQDAVIMDGLERSRGYKYMVSLDIDEYLVSNRNETWRPLFDRLWRQRPNAAGFIFGTYLYTTDWGPTFNNSEYVVGRFINRTRLTADRNKHVIMPTRLKKIYTHRFIPLAGYKRYDAPETEAAIRHYRGCRKDGYLETTERCFDFQRYSDDYLYRLFKTIEPRLDNILLDVRDIQL